MSPDQNNPDDNLRHSAQERLKHMDPDNLLPRIEISAQRLLHELHVHQIELEMQNEELRASRAEAEVAAARYTDLYDFAPIGYFTFDRQGTMIQTNLTGAALLGVERVNLQNKRFVTFVTEGDRPAFSTFLEQAFALRSPPPTCEVTLESKDGQALFVQITAMLSADGQECRAVAADITERRKAEETQKERNADLEHFNKLAIGRELRMIELKKEVNALDRALDRDETYF